MDHEGNSDKKDYSATDKLEYGNVVLQRLVEYRKREMRLTKGYVDLQRLIVRFGIERLIYRVSASSLSQDFVLKGAMLLSIYIPDDFRSTKDADFLTKGYYTKDEIKQAFAKFCAVPCNDGIVFEPRQIEVIDAGKDREYPGFKVFVPTQLGSANFKIEVDICFGEAVTPPAVNVKYPCLLDFPIPVIKVYPLETIIAEKFHTIVDKGIPNTRTKDFHDLQQIALHQTLDGETTRQALIATFKRRGKKLSESVPVALLPEIYNSKSKQQEWKTFLKNAMQPKSRQFGEACELIKQMMMPVLIAATRDEAFRRTWKEQAWTPTNAS
jgi:predicted nucleotidyltransferase component of viral defense system